MLVNINWFFIAAMQFILYFLPFFWYLFPHSGIFRTYSASQGLLLDSQMELN